MLHFQETFTSFSVNDPLKAKAFYQDTLGLKVEQTPEGLALHLGKGMNVFIYAKPNHTPATFTVLNFKVNDLKTAIQELKERDIHLEHYTSPPTGADGIFHRDEKSAMAWFKDPAGNILSIMEGE